MKKKISKIAIFVAAFFIIAVASSNQNVFLAKPNDSSSTLNEAIAMYVGSPKALVNNKEAMTDKSDTAIYPFEQDGKVLVPLRFVSESMGAQVGYDNKEAAITVKSNGKLLKISVGKSNINVGKTNIKLNIPVTVINKRSFIELSPFAKALDKKVFYSRHLIVISNKDKIFDLNTESALMDQVISKLNTLPVLGSYDNLKNLLVKNQQNQQRNFHVNGVVTLEAANMDMAKGETAAATAPVAQAAGKSKEASSDFSATNVQVQGVDEADVVKTDGQYIYQVNKQRIIIAKAYPANDMKVVSTVSFKDTNFIPQEIYLHKNNLVVIGNTSNFIPLYRAQADAPKMEKRSILPGEPNGRGYNPTTKAIVYDITDKANVKQVREIELDGYYCSSRKISSSLYLVANKSINYYWIQDGTVNATPAYRDTLVKDEFIDIGYSDIRYFPDFVEPNYMLIAGLDLDNQEGKLNLSTYLGSTNNIYASEKNLYTAVTNYRTIEKQSKVVATDNGKAIEKMVPVQTSENCTVIYKFALNNGKADFTSKGEVPGTILNQFSMDEHNKYFRIATTKGDSWRNDENTSKNNIYVLDEQLNTKGKIEDIAPGERIYSVRFMGDRGYIVTFKTVDPLFVIDLKEATNPKILGALKIPGYSDYLHPYDENHIIGFGKDTIEMAQKDQNGKVVSTNAYYLGMKMAIFDVTDVKNPKEMFVEKIGDRGTDSELLRNHKALLFSKAKNLLAFPVSVMEVNGQDLNTNVGAPQYGQFAFQGAYVYNVDLTNGFKLKGKITHISDDEYLKAGDYWYDGDKNVDRILYIDDILYTLSNKMFKANKIEDLKELGNLLIP